jgi:GIY-YIG catalytic domain
VDAHVAWVETERPWLAEQRLIAPVNFPLNPDQNRQHAFHQQLIEVRADARRTARTPPIVST